MNKKGQLITSLLILIVIGIVAVLFFAGWKYGFGLINDQLISISSSTDNVSNVSDVALKTFNYVNSGLGNLNIIAFSILFGFIIATLFMAFYSREHPVLLVVYILIITIIVVASIFIRNSYNELLSNSVLGATIQEFTLSNYIIGNFPVIISIVGIFGIIIMFAGIIKGREFEGY